MKAETSSADPAPASSVKLKTTSFWGPFARGTVVLNPSKAPIRNDTKAGRIVHAAVVSPLVNEGSNLAADAGAVTADVASGALSSGAYADVTLGGLAPARPGSYSAQLDIECEGDVSISTPMRIEVAASAIWGVACLLFGLCLLGFANLLTGQGDVAELTRRILFDRATFHANWERNPAPFSQAEKAAEIDRDYEDALRSLSTPRGFSIADRRVAEATAFLASARDLDAKLRDAMTAPQGAMEVTDLDQEWSAFKTLLASFDGSAVLGAPQQGLAAHVEALIGGLQARLVAAPARAIVFDLEPQIQRIRLTMAAGQGPQAREMALTMRAWKRRAADDLKKRLSVQMGFELLGNNLLASQARLRRLATDESIRSEARTDWTASLEAADAKLASGLTLKNFQQADEMVQDAETRSMREQKDALLARVHDVEQAAGQELSLDAVQAEFAKMGPPGKLNDAEYAAAMSNVFETWRAAVPPSGNDTSRQILEKVVASGVAAAKQQNLAGIKQAYAALKNEWRSFIAKHIAASTATVVIPICQDWREFVMGQIASVGEQVKLQSGRQEVEKWEKELDSTRLGLSESSVLSVDCLSSVADAFARVNSVSRQAFQDTLEDAGIPLDARLDAAEHSGDAAAVTAMQRLMIGPRDLRLRATTGNEDIVVDQPIHFVFDNLDSNWSGPGVDITVDWGDGSELLGATAENLMSGERLEHRFQQIETYKVKAAALIDERIIGESLLPLAVAPSPVNFARRLADIFLTSQFALALLVAAIVYFWRFHAGTVVFGSAPIHYLQAFALGFAVFAAVADLPKAIGDWVLK